MIINTKTTVAFKVPSEYKQAMKFMEEHPNWKDESDNNTWRYTNMQTFFTSNSQESEIARCGECKHMIADGRCMEFADDGIRPSAMDYCSYGERREDGEA